MKIPSDMKVDVLDKMDRLVRTTVVDLFLSGEEQALQKVVNKILTAMDNIKDDKDVRPADLKFIEQCYKLCDKKGEQ